MARVQRRNRVTEPNVRPIGVTLVAWLFIAAGIAGATAVLVWFVRSGRIKEGLPIEMLLGITAAVLLGVVAGAKLLQGARWAWYEATGLGVLAVGVGGFSFVMNKEWGPPVLAPILVAFGLAACALLLSGNAPGFFGLGTAKAWTPVLAELVVCAAALTGVHFLTQEAAPEAADSSQLLQSLGEHEADSDQDIQFMLERLETGNQAERISAGWALGRSGRAEAIPGLLRAAREDADTAVRINAIGSMAALGGPEIESDLVGFLYDADAEVQSAGLRGLADAKFAGATAQVGRVLLENLKLRGLAVDVLGRMGNPEAISYLRQAVDDTDEDVRTRIAFALGKLGDAGGVPVLVGLLQDEQWTVRANAVQALGMIGDSAAREAIEKLLDDPNSAVRSASEAALEKLP